MLLRLAYLGVTNVFALLRLLPMSSQEKDAGGARAQLRHMGQFPALPGQGPLACDFFETVTLSGARLHVLAVIEHASRRIRILGATAHRTAPWVAQAARNLVIDLQDAGCRARYLIRDRDGKFPALFDTILADAGIETVLSGVRMPRMNAYAERFVRTVRAECTDRMLIAGEQHLREILADYIGHYNTGRSHQGDGMGLRAPDDDPDIIAFPGPLTCIQRRTRLAGLINEYRQAA